MVFCLLLCNGYNRNRLTIYKLKPFSFERQRFCLSIYNGNISKRLTTQIGSDLSALKDVLSINIQWKYYILHKTSQL